VLVVSVLIKTQAVVLAPLLFVSTLRLHGARGLVRAAGLTLGMLALLQAPLILAGNYRDCSNPTMARSALPRTTVAAYNLWFLALDGGSARDTEFVLGSISYRSAGIALFGIVTAIVCLALLRDLMHRRAPRVQRCWRWPSSRCPRRSTSATCS